MKAYKTFIIGLVVMSISIVQLIIAYSLLRFIGLGVGLFFVVFGWKIGWATYPGFTVMVGHLAVTVGCLTIAYSIYQLPFVVQPPSLLQTLDLPLFWGLFTLFGGQCMIKHGCCRCTMAMHLKNNGGKA